MNSHKIDFTKTFRTKLVKIKRNSTNDVYLRILENHVLKQLEAGSFISEVVIPNALQK